MSLICTVRGIKRLLHTVEFILSISFRQSHFHHVQMSCLNDIYDISVFVPVSYITDRTITIHIFIEYMEIPDGISQISVTFIFIVRLKLLNKSVRTIFLGSVIIKLFHAKNIVFIECADKNMSRFSTNFFRNSGLCLLLLLKMLDTARCLIVHRTVFTGKKVDKYNTREEGYQAGHSYFDVFCRYMI